MNSILQSNKCSVGTYALAAVSTLGMEVLDWDPLVVRDSFETEFGVQLTDRAFNKLMAGLTMIGTNAFLATIEGFLECTAACANMPVIEGQTPYVNLRQIAWALYLYKELVGKDIAEEDIVSPDVIVYIQAQLQLHGITKVPDYMEFAAPTPEQLEPIQAALVSDAAAFSAYNMREANEVTKLNNYVAAKQSQLLEQLKALEGYNQHLVGMGK